MDVDTPSTQSPLKYSLDKIGQAYFRVDPLTGIIYTDGRIDREQIPFVFFTVFVTDGKYTENAGVKVTFTDINDNAPVFPNPPYYGYISENAAIGTRLMIIQAVDRDDPEAGGNTKIEYSLVDNSNNEFGINSQTGEITSLASFDREGEANYTIVVRATDKGTPSLSSTVKVGVIVYDENDNRPKFTDKFFYGQVPEDAFQGHYITQVTATDEDDTFNAMFEFRVIAGNDDPYSFYIEPATGKIVVSGLLDFEKKSSYNLTVTVRDRGMPPLEAHGHAYVIIKVLDMNTHPPVFTAQNYNVEVREDVPIGHEVVTVNTTDRDQKHTTKSLTYTIVNGNEKGLFSIQENKKDFFMATIRTVARLDREDTKQFTLMVNVTDELDQMATSTVFIKVLDVNDNGPVFQPSYYMSTIKEKVNAEQYVTTIKAIDPDSATNGAPFTFTLMNSTLNDRFKIKTSTITQTSAQLFSYGLFERAKTPSFTLYIKATDSGNPPLSSFSYVFVDVLDQGNTHEPFNANMTIIVNALNGHFIGGIIGNPYYKDDDFTGDVNTYSIVSQSPGSYFTINTNNGNITAAKDLPLGNFKVAASITETNPRPGATAKTVTSNIDVIVRNVTRASVKASVTLRLSMLRLEYFVGDYYYKVSLVLLSIFH